MISKVENGISLFVILTSNVEMTANEARMYNKKLDFVPGDSVANLFKHRYLMQITFFKY